MNVGLVCRSAAARLRRAGLAIKEFCGPLAAADVAAPTTSSKPAVPPFCVWHGRAVFCMYYPEPHPLPEAGDGPSARRTGAASAGSPR